MAAANRSIPPRPGTATLRKVFCAISASRSSDSRPLSSARSTPRWGCLAACSSRARPSGGGTDERSRRLANAKPLGEFAVAFPISSASKAQLLALYDATHDPLAGKTAAEKLEILKRTTYRDYLTGPCGCSEEVANCFQGRTLGFFGLGCDAVPAADARELGYPGFDGLRLPTQAPTREPYIYHFPDGNASLA